jgi:hypothetical protein
VDIVINELENLQIMNDLVQQLAKQAKLAVPAGLAPDVWIEQYNEILGRLIIAECVTVMHEQERIPAGFFYSKPAHVHELAIRQHFGVE